MPDSTTNPPPLRLPSVNANIRLLGSISDAMVSYLQQELDTASSRDGSIVIELTTSGGDAESARRMACEIGLFRRYASKEAFFLGKTVVYSAGVTFMSAFPRTHRFLSEDTVLLIHERRLNRDVHFSGSTTNDIQVARQVLALLEAGQRLEQEDFARLAEGSSLTVEDITRRAALDWYVTAKEALALGLIAGII